MRSISRLLFALGFVTLSVSFSLRTGAAATPNASVISDFYKQWRLEPSRSDGNCADRLSAFAPKAPDLGVNFFFYQGSWSSDEISMLLGTKMEADKITIQTSLENGVLKQQKRVARSLLAVTTMRLSPGDLLDFDQNEGSFRRHCRYTPLRPEIVGKTVTEISLVLGDKVIATCIFLAATTPNSPESCTLSGYRLESRPIETQNRISNYFRRSEHVQKLVPSPDPSQDLVIQRSSRKLNLDAVYTAFVPNLLIQKDFFSKKEFRVPLHREQIGFNPYVYDSLPLSGNATLRFKYGLLEPAH